MLKVPSKPSAAQQKHLLFLMLRSLDCTMNTQGELFIWMHLPNSNCCLPLLPYAGKAHYGLYIAYSLYNCKSNANYFTSNVEKSSVSCLRLATHSLILESRPYSCQVVIIYCSSLQKNLPHSSWPINIAEELEMGVANPCKKLIKEQKLVCHGYYLSV